MTYSAALLYYKGFHAIQTHRIAHVLWNSGRKVRCRRACVLSPRESCVVLIAYCMLGWDANQREALLVHDVRLLCIADVGAGAAKPC